jgi:hypothetical protein
MFVFLILAKVVSLKVVHPLKIHQNTEFHGPTLSGTSFVSRQKFERLPFWNGCSYSIKNYGVEVSFNSITSLLNLIKIYQLVQKLIEGDRQTVW